MSAGTHRKQAKSQKKESRPAKVVDGLELSAAAPPPDDFHYQIPKDARDPSLVRAKPVLETVAGFRQWVRRREGLSRVKKDVVRALLSHADHDKKPVPFDNCYPSNAKIIKRMDAPITTRHLARLLDELEHVDRLIERTPMRLTMGKRKGERTSPNYRFCNPDTGWKSQGDCPRRGHTVRPENQRPKTAEIRDQQVP